MRASQTPGTTSQRPTASDREAAAAVWYGDRIGSSRHIPGSRPPSRPHTRRQDLLRKRVVEKDARQPRSCGAGRPLPGRRRWAPQPNGPRHNFMQRATMPSPASASGTADVRGGDQSYYASANPRRELGRPLPTAKQALAGAIPPRSRTRPMRALACEPKGWRKYLTLARHALTKIE